MRFGWARPPAVVGRGREARTQHHLLRWLACWQLRKLL